jgi:hypothetical protein
MKVSYWHHTADRQPPKSGYYISFRGWGLGGKADGDHDYGYVYYDKRDNEWRDYESTSYGHYAIVYYWTDATPDEWVDNDPPVSSRKRLDQLHPTEQAALADLEEAIKRYETVKALCAKQ